MIWLLTPLLVAHMLLQAGRGGGRRHLFERLGYVPRRERTTYWIHAASVGEVQTVWPLVDALAARSGEAAIVVSTATVTGAVTVAERGEGRIAHVYLPIDHPLAVRRFLHRLDPRSGCIVETEIWPVLYAACRQTGVPLTIVNGRLSDRTFRHREGLLASTFRRALAGVRVLARTDDDAARFRRLGAGRVEVAGNLKFVDNRPSRVGPRPVDVTFALLASTHDDEEVRFAAAWLAADVDTPLVIAPRHPVRADRLQATLAALLASRSGDHPAATRIPRRSLGDSLRPNDRFYLADTLGELQSWYDAAATCAVGGSWVPVGGHNLLEPARLSRAPIVGPHLSNVPDLAEALRAVDGLVETQTVEAAVAALIDDLAHPDVAAARGHRAARLAATGPAVLAHYLDRITLSEIDSPLAR